MDSQAKGSDQDLRGPVTDKGKISYLFLTQNVIFISCLIASNIIAVKLIQIGPFVLPAAIVIFPLTYVFGDVLTEVYGYARARSVIWWGFIANLLVVVFIKVAEVIPPAWFWESQDSYHQILGYTPRILLASFSAYLAGEFLNSYVLSRVKILTGGRFLWVRTIGSTIVGQFADSCVFIILAFAGSVVFRNLVVMIAAQWLFKVVYEALLTPVTYQVVRFVKRKEQLDTFDRRVNYNPFRFGSSS